MRKYNNVAAIAGLILVFLLGTIGVAGAASSSQIKSAGSEKVGTTQDPMLVSVEKLIEFPLAKDGSTVTFSGEAIGEALNATHDKRWVNLNEDGTAVGVVVNKEDADKISYWGKFNTTGDTVKIVGVVNLACPEHDGGFDVHATKFEIVKKGENTTTPIKPYKAFAAVVFLFLAAFCIRIYIRKRKSI